MTTIVNLEDARNRQRSACDSEKFFALLDGWELERPEDGLTPRDILELIAELADVMDFSADYVAGYLKLHRGQEVDHQSAPLGRGRPGIFFADVMFALKFAALLRFASVSKKCRFI